MHTKRIPQQNVQFDQTLVPNGLMLYSEMVWPPAPPDRPPTATDGHFRPSGTAKRVYYRSLDGGV